MDIESAAPLIAEAAAESRGISRLLEHMPIALWEVDARSPATVFERLKADGVTDIAGYLRNEPQLVEFALDTVMVTRLNRAAMQMLGEEDASEYPRSVRHIFQATPDAAIRVMTAHFEGRRNHVEELRIDSFDDRSIDVLFLVTFPQSPEPMDVTFIAMLDITDRLAAEANLRRLQADLAHASRVATLGELATSMAHEIKQPLGAIVMNGGTSLRWLAGETPNIPKARMLIERMMESATQATDIINRIRVMASKHVPQPAALSINEIVETSLRFVGHDALEKGVAIRPALDPDLPHVMGDRVQLQQVAVNLVVNAMQAIDHGRSRRREVLVSTVLREDGRVQLTVQDTGPGIPLEHIGRLFEGFFTTKSTGMGLGLTICESIVRSFDGEIEVENVEGGGASFRIVLPAAA
ncbi:ATP-binding protein [Sphingomonas sp. BK235]|uniref:sensor histidine kinase n=1 Tax=Sphingomonas sp. BK235 TaxID=2512131 RepID=UPI0010E452AF|nr:ATP-binding protein [Sphingomonas sp. BK235]TCP36040.1 phospho-acceptor domain-containing protein [Sphingomonas sp. BK235]